VSAREAYPRRAKHNTVAEGGNRRSAIASSSQIRRSPRSFGQLPRGGMLSSVTSRSAAKTWRDLTADWQERARRPTVDLVLVRLVANGGKPLHNRSGPYL
jgi:hypothetical protein